jgi:drug/metabolite transporter (DMT)-like permease
MSPTAALWTSIVLGACAQVFLKRGVSPNSKTGTPQSGFSLLFSGWVLAWAACFVVATGLWLVSLSRMEISYAFPLLSLGYPIVAILSMMFLKERVNTARWIAILIITIGVAIIARTA